MPAAHNLVISCDSACGAFSVPAPGWSFSDARSDARMRGWHDGPHGTFHCPACPDLLDFHLPSKEALYAEIDTAAAIAAAQVFMNRELAPACQEAGTRDASTTDHPQEELE